MPRIRLRQRRVRPAPRGAVRSAEARRGAAPKAVAADVGRRSCQGRAGPSLKVNFRRKLPLAAVLKHMNITADTVKQLRERTGAGMMECKKALVETQGDLDAAAE